MHRSWIAAVLVGCSSPPDLAGDEACVAYHEQLAVLAGTHGSGATGSNPLLASRCRARGITVEYVECIRRSSTLDDAEACRPRSDQRPASARPDAATCEAVVAHLDRLVAAVTSAPPQATATRIARMECMRWATRSQLACQLAATSLADTDRCGP